MIVNVCVPTLRRSDMLLGLLTSLRQSTVTPKVWIVNNGHFDVREITIGHGFEVDIFTPRIPMGVAESWNWFIDNVPEERVIANDDVTFAPDSLERLTASDADLAWAESCGFSCFLLRDHCVSVVGMFDESISPGYGYYEDEDYLQRIDGKGTREPLVKITNVNAGVVHLKSKTLESYTEAEMQEHHRKFHIARRNYMTKHGIMSL